MPFQLQPLGGHALKGVGAGLLLGLGNGDLFLLVELGINTFGQQGAGLSPSFSGGGEGNVRVGAETEVGPPLVTRAVVVEQPQLAPVRFNPQVEAITIPQVVFLPLGLGCPQL